MIRLFCCFTFLMIIGELSAQPSFTKTRYSEQQGLSHNTVLNLTMDNRGFLWIATLDGLNRFDGLQIKTFRTDLADSNTVSDNFIHGIHQLKNGKLLVSTRDGGLNIYDPSFDSFSRINEAGFPDQEVNLIWQDSESQYWVSFSGHSLGLFSPETFEYFPAIIVDAITKEKKEPANDIIEFNDKSMLISSFNGLYYLTRSEIEKYKNNPATNTNMNALSVPFSKNDLYPNSSNLYVDSNGDLWVNFVNSGLQKMNSDLIPDFLKQSIETGITESSPLVVERNGYLISGYVNNKMLYVDLETGTQTIKPFDTSTNIEGATYLYEDLNKELWAYTWGSGFYKLKQKQGITLINNTVQPGVFESNFMLGFEEDKNGFWIGTAREALFYNNDGTIYSLNQRLANDQIQGFWDFERDSSGLWIVTNEKGLVFIADSELNKAKNIQSIRLNHQNSILKSKNLHQVLRDSRGWLWLGYEGDGIQIIKNPESLFSDSFPEVIELNSQNAPEKLSISSSNIREFYEDKNQNIWVSTLDAGFIRIEINDKEVKSISNFRHNPNDKNSIPHNDGRSVYQQNDSTYWFATYGGGIAKWNSKKNLFTRYNTTLGLPNNSTYSVVGENNEAYIWVSTNSGLARLNTLTEQFEEFTEADGIQNNEFNTGAYTTLGDGRLVFGGINGLNIISTQHLKQNKKIPPVYITGINLFNEPLNTDSAHTIKRYLKLPYDKNFLSFNFAALDFEKPLKNNFTYKLDGVDLDWVNSGNRNYASYPNLQPGNYVFTVKASNSEGIWNNNGAKLYIRITPPWWQTIWFRLSTTVIILIALIMGVRHLSQRRLRKQIRKMEIDNKLRNERERISRDLHDHVGAQLANIMSGLSLVDKYNQVDNKEKSLSLMNSLRGDAEITIKQLRETIWALNQNELTITAFKEHLHTYFSQQTSFNEGLKIELNFQDNGKTTLSSTQALNLFRIMQEAAQNTLKYSGANLLVFAMHEEDARLYITIKDNGTFKALNKPHRESYGLGNMRKRTLELQGFFEIDTKNGTEIKIHIPL